MNKELTNQQINEGIAVYLGWRRGYSTGLIMPIWLNPEGKSAKIPDFCNDLNAMHQAEKKLLMVGPICNYVASVAGSLEYGEFSTDAFLLMHATARQRAEAFLVVSGCSGS